MADIINSVDRSLDMYIYDLYIYRYISAVWAQRCGAGGCRREATWINYNELLNRIVYLKVAGGRAAQKMRRNFFIV